MKFFSSDHHFSHANIMRYCARPFNSVEEMNREMIVRHNAVVRKNDDIYMLGDLGWSISDLHQILPQLNGRKFWVPGNHDRDKHRSSLAHYFIKVDSIQETKQDGQFIVMCHYPMIRWNRAHHGSWMIHGHCHGTLEYPFEGKIIDVGVDKWDFTPVSFAQLKAYMDAKPLVERFTDREQE